MFPLAEGLGTEPPQLGLGLSPAPRVSANPDAFHLRGMFLISKFGEERGERNIFHALFEAHAGYA